MSAIRLEPKGPSSTGLSPLQLDPADFQSELPTQNWHIYHIDEDLSLTVGVWTTTDMQEALGPYPGDEFMHILEGEVCILDADGNATIINQGQTFVIQNGAHVSWKQIGFCRKFFMTYIAPDVRTKKFEHSSQAVHILCEADLETELNSSTSSRGVIQREAEAFLNESKKMQAGMWETEQFETDMVSSTKHEFVQVLQGSVSICGEDGHEQRFSSGDCFFIPAGSFCSSKSTEFFRKFYCTLSVEP